ncbi:Odorant receptor 22c [Lucilia cuprina]|nr:Odorant receptor 22c [Lucilia cuprina]
MFSFLYFISLFVASRFTHIQSAAVAETLYDIEWYKCDVKTRKMILMMLRRSQRPTTIAVPFFTPSLTAFSSSDSCVSS